MHSTMRHELVDYQNPFLAMRIWQIDSVITLHEEARRSIERDLQQKRYYGWHYHEEIEIILILEGEMTAFCNEERYELHSGDIVIFGSSEPHTTLKMKEGNLSYIVFQIDLRKYWDLSNLNNMQHFSEVIRPLSSLNYIYRINSSARSTTANLIREIYQEMNDRCIGYELAVSSRIKSMLLLLLRHDTQLQLNYNDNQLLERLQPVVNYVERNLSEKMSVTELSKLLNMSYTHFIKTFKKAIGMSFTEFVTYKRIKKAEQQLLTTRTSIAEVAQSVGFSNLGHFYELFRRYNHCSPKQFKDRLSKQLNNI